MNVIRQLPETETLHAPWRSPQESVKSPTLRRVRDETIDVLGQDERCQDLANSGKQFGFHKPGIVVLKQQTQPSVAYGTNDHDEKCTVIPFRLQVPWLRRHSFSCIEPVRVRHGCLVRLVLEA
jgi:hypothetical protein